MSTDAEATEMDHSDLVLPEEDDPFLEFVDSVISRVFPRKQNSAELEEKPMNLQGWSWIMDRIIKTCVAYPTGVTPAILQSEVDQAWNELNRSGTPKTQSERILELKRKHKRAKLPNTVTIDSIDDHNFLSLDSVLEAVILRTSFLPETRISMLTLGDVWSSNTVDLYLHGRFKNIVDSENGILKEGREILLTGCRLWAAGGDSCGTRLLSTEYLVVLLDEGIHDDAILISTQFSSDSFSSISLDAVKEGTTCSLYTRIEQIECLQGKDGSLQRKQIILVDKDGVRLKFLLSGQQTLVANLLSVGSMLAIDKPSIASSIDSSPVTCNEIFLQYGLQTQLYLVPFFQREEQVSLTWIHNHGSRLFNALNPTPRPSFCRATSPCDSQWSIDFKNYPYRISLTLLQTIKMTGISLYGIVTDIRRNSEARFSLKIADVTGAIWIDLHFIRSWSLGRLGVGHAVYISGLSSSLTPQTSLELSWHENDTEASVVNTSCLDAFLYTSCLHKSTCILDLSKHMSGAQVCRVWIHQIEHMNTRFMHVRCGHLVDLASSGDLECKFCCCICNAEVHRTFHLKINLADDTGKLFAWCIGKTAAELLEITPDEFYELPVDTQKVYPSSLLGRKKFFVAVVNCKRLQESNTVEWEVTGARTTVDLES